ncbi:Nif3-like dinuclear metal center hexameric protein [Sphingomonas sp. IW22]|uniref:Nif3-like dinuclear metal center hexameric protein n=1 Tax=Sphingomonas sp. IW22 TaxID=3242489 RepID=UPI0035201B1E
MSQKAGLTRRQVGIATIAAGTLGWRPALAATPTAADIVRRMADYRGDSWKPDGLDGFTAGDPQVPVSGVAVTAMPDLKTLQRAVAQGCNMVVSIESPLYARPPAPAVGDAASGPAQVAERLRADPTYRGKLHFIARNRMAVFRLSDNLGSGDDPLVQGIANTMGWQRYCSADNPRRFDIPRGSLAALAASVKRQLGVNGGMRVIGQGDHAVSRVLVVPSRIDPVAVVKQLPQADVLLAGDLREWELVEYLHDSWETDAPKSLIAVGRILSEQPGMLAAASWLRSVANVPVRPLMVEDPFWRLPA